MVIKPVGNGHFENWGNVWWERDVNDTDFWMYPVAGFCIWKLLPVLVTCPVAGFCTTNAEDSYSAAALFCSELDIISYQTIPEAPKDLFMIGITKCIVSVALIKWHTL